MAISLLRMAVSINQWMSVELWTARQDYDAAIGTRHPVQEKFCSQRRIRSFPKEP
ncbi:MAG: hypothetical protein ACREOO_23975 [bacterium]